ncbi:hypothetical protein [Marinicella meishanensis]|uniref:hypothetical protein n=1 Tax=Marinicella meishanensis TaxID=2873263 RepID=UPI001CBB40D2|nr:hypothetical protein [Marinicella sp. NBU2979]
MNKKFLTLAALGVISHSLAAEPVTMRSGVLVDDQQQQALIMLPEGGIAALDLKTGTTNWRTAASDKPIVLNGNQLLSQKQHQQKGSLSLVYHDTSNGQVLNSTAVELPSEVMASVVDGAGHQFKLEQSTQQATQLHWSYSGGTAQGMSPDVLELGSQRTPASTNNNRQSGVINLNITDLSIVSAAPAALAPVAAQTEQAVLADKTGRQFVSPKGQFVLISERLPSNQAIKYRWTIYTASGQQLGQLTAPMSYAPFTVVGDLLLYMTPATGQLSNGALIKNPPLLKAHSLSKQQPVWEHPVRDLKYFGQMPI